VSDTNLSTCLGGRYKQPGVVGYNTGLSDT
jgi:hypothetical protein